jgi:multisubunit Na+/H+ antiporter MnhG subunit
MKKILLIILGAIGLTIVIVAILGIYRFNFTDDDIYVENEQGKIVPFDDLKN